MDELPNPITRSEQYLAKIAGAEPTLPTPITREERYLAKIAGEDVDIPPAPITRTEQYLAAIVEGGGGGGVEVEALSVTQNNTYTAPEGKAYSPVVVNVPNSYAAGDEGKVVSSGALVSQSSDTVTENGTVDTTLINSLTVNVAGGGEAEDGIIDRSISGTYTNSRVTNIGTYAFYYCQSLTNASFPNATTVSHDAFAFCANLKNIYIPSVTSFGSSAFAWCQELQSVDTPLVTEVPQSCFYQCRSLSAMSFPSATSIGQNAFVYCERLTTVNFPAATYIGGGAFSSCSKITTAIFPMASFVGTSAFIGCSSLTAISLPSAKTIANNAFARCYRLISLYLLGSSVASLGGSSAFYSTPIGGYSTSAGQFGSIFVPSSLYSSYLASTNWAYFSSRFVSV